MKSSKQNKNIKNTPEMNIAENNSSNNDSISKNSKSSSSKNHFEKEEGNYPTDIHGLFERLGIL